MLVATESGCAVERGVGRAGSAADLRRNMVETLDVVSAEPCLGREEEETADMEGDDNVLAKYGNSVFGAASAVL